MILIQSYSCPFFGNLLCKNMDLHLGPKNSKNNRNSRSILPIYLYPINQMMNPEKMTHYCYPYFEIKGSNLLHNFDPEPTNPHIIRLNYPPLTLLSLIFQDAYYFYVFEPFKVYFTLQKLLMFLFFNLNYLENQNRIAIRFSIDSNSRPNSFQRLRLLQLLLVD